MSFLALYIFREIILESSQNVSETTPRLLKFPGHEEAQYWLFRIDVYCCSSVNVIILCQTKSKYGLKNMITCL